MVAVLEGEWAVALDGNALRKNLSSLIDEVLDGLEIAVVFGRKVLFYFYKKTNFILFLFL